MLRPRIIPSLLIHNTKETGVVKATRELRGKFDELRNLKVHHRIVCETGTVIDAFRQAIPDLGYRTRDGHSAENLQCFGYTSIGNTNFDAVKISHLHDFAFIVI